MVNAIEIVDVYKNYGGPPVVQGVTFEVAVGETVALIGPNGAGKTTLFGVVAGERRATKGSVRFFERDVTRFGAKKMSHLGVARTFQIARYFLDKSVEENVCIAYLAKRGGFRSVFGARLRSNADVDSALAAVGLDRMRKRPSRELSHGDRKNLEIAMALAQDPSVLLLDEPTAGMATEDIPRTIELLKALRRDRPELACIITAHDMEVVFALADRVVLMASGRVALMGTPEEVRTSPLTREIYLGSTFGVGDE